MKKEALTPNRSGHLSRVVHDLLRCGWKIERIPAVGKIPRNGLNLVLKTSGQDVKLRIFVYKITSSSRNRPHERRIEITTTYQGGLARLRGFSDVVIGWDGGSDRYVGVDSRRLHMGGATHNASSFFDPTGLSAKSGELLINPRGVASALFPNGIEQHAFFDRTRLSEYLLNHQAIHAGRYTFEGFFSGDVFVRNVQWPVDQYNAYGDALCLTSPEGTVRSVSDISPKIIAAVQQKDFSRMGGRKISFAEYKQILSICEEIGLLGEQYVLAGERKRLIRQGRSDLADNVQHVSVSSVGEGYDILSFEKDGSSERYLEVKTTTGNGCEVDISRREWEMAEEHGEKYYIVRVISIKSRPRSFFIRDPVEQARKGKITKTSSGWKLDLKAVM